MYLFLLLLTLVSCNFVQDHPESQIILEEMGEAAIQGKMIIPAPDKKLPKGSWKDYFWKVYEPIENEPLPEIEV